MCSGSEAGSYLRLIDSCINQLKAQGPPRTCNESKEEEETIEFCAPLAGTRMRPRVPHLLNQIVFFNCLDLYRKSPDSGERQCKSRA